MIAYDDIALHPLNPFPGKLFNRPGGPDVYSGITIDYKREEANARNFLGVLRGNTSLVAKNERASGRVLLAGPKDRSFVYYSDHGAPGLVGMPAGVPLWANQLHAALRARGANYETFASTASAVASASAETVSAFSGPSTASSRPQLSPGTLVFYLEACESGSMFTGLLDPSLPIYATTAANGEESSWGTYCPTFSLAYNGNFVSVSPTPSGDVAVPRNATDANGVPLDGPSGLLVPVLNTCLGDLYSVSWLEDAEAASADTETLKSQYKSVRDRTSNDGTFEMGSHVLRFNNGTIDKDVLDDFEGADDNGSRRDWGANGGGDEDAWADARAEAVSAARSEALAANPTADADALLESIDPEIVESIVSARLRSLYAGSVRNRDADLVPLRVAAAGGDGTARLALDAELTRRREVSTKALVVSAGALKALLRREKALDTNLLRSVVLTTDQGGNDAAASSQALASSLSGLSEITQARFSTLAIHASEVSSAATRASSDGADADAAVAVAVSALQSEIVEVERREYAMAVADGASYPSSLDGVATTVSNETDPISFAALNLFTPTSAFSLAVLSLAAADPLPASKPDTPLVENWDCLRSSFVAWASACAPTLRQPDLGLARTFANLCNVGVTAADVQDAVKPACVENGLGYPAGPQLDKAASTLIDEVVGSTVTVTGERDQLDNYARTIDVLDAVRSVGGVFDA